MTRQELTELSGRADGLRTDVDENRRRIEKLRNDLDKNTSQDFWTKMAAAVSVIVAVGTLFAHFYAASVKSREVQARVAHDEKTIELDEARLGLDLHERLVEVRKEMAFAHEGDVQEDRRRLAEYLEHCIRLFAKQSRIHSIAPLTVLEGSRQAPTARQIEMAKLLQSTQGMPGFDAEDHYRRGLAYFEIGEHQEATRALEEAVRMAPDTARYVEARDRVAELLR